MILLLTDPLDLHADVVEIKLHERHADLVRFNPARFPAQAEVSLSYSLTGQIQSVLRTEHKSIELQDITAVWYRRPQPPIPHEEIADKVSRDFIADECNDFVKDLWHSLDCLWLPAPPFVIQQGQLKASQLKVAANMGFEIPPTLFTNSPIDFIDFYNQHNGKIISKLAGRPFGHVSNNIFVRYTEVVSKRDVAYAQALRFCPVIFQAYIPKQVELRITVVGRKVFAAEIRSQETNHTRHDWRRYDNFKTPYFIHELPQDISWRCIQLVEKMGLCYGAIDMIVTPDGRYVFLEINSNGQYLWIEQATGLPISDAIADLLMFPESANKNIQHQFQLYSGGRS